MTKLELLINYFLGPLVSIAVISGCLFGLNLLLSHLQRAHPERSIHRQVVMVITTLIALIGLIVLLPIDDALRGQILSLLGILLSATIALSSTTFLGNALAGVLLRNVRSFRTGDFIYINEQFGRVSGRGLFHIEIQTRDRDLVTLPNLYVTNNPVKVIRDSGTMVSAEVSLGYDVPRGRIETLLAQAARESGLEDPFVHIMQLGDFSVHYRVNGMLTDVKQLLSARSRLNGAIIDTLHNEGIEIVSPRFMNTRDVAEQTFIARPDTAAAGASETKDPEGIIFDKAEKAATLEEQKACLSELEQRAEALGEEMSAATEDQKAKLSQMLDRLRGQQERLSARIAHDAEKIDKEKSVG
ncbi:MAG: mechanosensitive ion channel [Desulfuromonadales bacterium]|nr:mechanosensitive ion channel [Desulfuromonadales bacterium]